MARLSLSDPHVPDFLEMRDHNFNLSSTELSAENLANQDAVILENHSAFDYSYK